MNNFEFELNMDDSYKNCKTIDEWGVAVVWAGYYGAEYNLCLEDGADYSAIYLMEYNDETDYWVTEYDCFKHYEINFNNPNWELELKKAMFSFVFNKLDY